MILTDKFSLIVLLFGLGAQIFRRSLLVQNLKLLWRLSFLGIFGISFFWSFLQYHSWRQNELGRFFLPPYQSIGYFFSYVFFRFLAPPIIAFFTALAIGKIAEFINHRFNQRFFEKEEYLLATLGTFLVGYPIFLLYFLLIFFFALLLSIFYSLKYSSRAPLFYLWLPTAILAIIIKIYFIPSSFFNFFAL